MSKICVLLADDHLMVRDGLRMLINTQPDMMVVGEADNGHAVVALALELQPDVVVMDIAMPELNGLKATEQLKALDSNIKILTLTRYAEDAYLQPLIKAGVNGYVLKQSASDELVRAIRAVAAGKSYFDPALMERVVGHTAGTRPVRGVPAEKNLSHREEEVLRLIAWGYLNKEIAARLKISIKTAEAHKANAMAKMGMKSRIDIVRYALLNNWLEIGDSQM